MIKTINEEENSFNESDFQENPPSDVVAYNELRSCADIFRMYTSETLDIQPDFQREEVWKGPSKTRFIDSLIKQLPIPSLCFSYDYENEEWQVIDGLQRITSIIKFLDPLSDWTLSKLDDVDPRISGVKAADFHVKGTALNKLKVRLENTSIPVTVLRCDPKKENHANYLFMIFHRLNSGGMKLNNQEIRNCIFSGTLNNLIKELDKDPTWVSVNEKTGNSVQSERYRRVELILRIFAFTDGIQDYEGELSKFLNNYMRKNRTPNNQFIAEKIRTFNESLEIVDRCIVRGQYKFGAAALESLIVAINSNLDSLKTCDDQTISAKLLKFSNLSELSTKELSEGIMKKGKLTSRIQSSIKCFS
ncbi:DUF262 domain-containing protein [Rheinheimera sediminis]|uniref:DUF262 domain-containing protein n=1 Tax=Rheinheimera sp. YQF-1 TaxID=2499626 RepID=UPI0016447844|nr:DUF262 domain-containing protein [Rheinheimera sp. YQF-1]